MSRDDDGQILGASLESLRSTRTSVKWQVYPDDVIPVWVAEMDTAPCSAVTEAVVAALGRGDTGYAWSPLLVEAFRGFASRRWDWEVPAGRIMQVPDVMIGVSEIIHAMVPTHGAVVLSPPVYDAFFGVVASTRRRLVEAPLGPDHRLDAQSLAAAFVEAGPGSVYLLCNPQNPTGTVHTAEELAMVASLTDQHEILVVSDEIHAPLVQPEATFVPYLAVPQAARGLALVSGSKAWNLAGLKTALLVLGEHAEHGLHEMVTHGAQHLAVIAQAAAYQQGEQWLDQLLAEIAERRLLLAALLDEHLPQVVLVPAQATYLAWLDCSALGLEDPAATFLTRGVAVVPGTRYDRRATQWVRVNLGTSADVITQAVLRMAG